MPRRLPSLFAEQEQRLRFCQAQLEDLDRIIEDILQPLQSMRLSIAMLLQHLKAFMQMGASKHPNYLDELLQYLESPSIKLTSYDVFKHSGSDYDFQDRFEDFPSSMSCVQQAIAVLGWTQVSLHGCEHEVGDSFANSIAILQELFETSNQSEKMAESNKRKPDRQEPKPQKARSVHDPQIPAGWPKVTDSSGLVGAEVSQICGGLTMHKMIPQSEGESTLHTSSAMKAIVGSNMGDSMLLSDPRGLLDGNDRLLDQREVAQLSRDLHIKETLFPIDKEPVQFAVSVYIEKSTGILTMLVEEIRFEASVDMAVSITQEIPEVSVRANADQRIQHYCSQIQVSRYIPLSKA